MYFLCYSLCIFLLCLCIFQVKPICITMGEARILVRETLLGLPPDAGEFWKMLKNLLRKLRKCIILAYFSMNLTNHKIIFRAFRRKTQIVWKIWKMSKISDENAIEKLNFNYFGKFFTKNRAFGNSTIFYIKFFRFGGENSHFHWLHPCVLHTNNICLYPVIIS